MVGRRRRKREKIVGEKRRGIVEGEGRELELRRVWSGNERVSRLLNLKLKERGGGGGRKKRLEKEVMELGGRGAAYFGEQKAHVYAETPDTCRPRSVENDTRVPGNIRRFYSRFCFRCSIFFLP